MKRLITFLLALILFTLPGWNITADAQGDELVLSLSSVEASPGDTIELVVSIESNPGIAGMQFGFEYDNSKLELLEGEPTGGLGGLANFVTQYVWANFGDTTYTGEIFKLSFKVKDNISEGGLTEVGITGAIVGNWAQEVLPYQIKPGGVNILIKHNLERVEAKSATCTEAGNITYWKCTDCGKLFRDGEGKEEIDAQSIVLPSLGHNAGHFAAVDPTCQDTGNIEYWYCDRCNEYFSDKTCENKVSSVVLATVPHDFNTLWRYDKDYHWHECAYSCGTTDAKSSHSLEWVVDKEATCTAPGVWHQECKICGYITNEDTEIPMVSHNLTRHEAVEATCTSEGNIEYWECSGCYKLFRDVNGETEVQSVTTNKLSHNFETELKYDKDYHLSLIHI